MPPSTVPPPGLSWLPEWVKRTPIHFFSADEQSGSSNLEPIRNLASTIFAMEVALPGSIPHEEVLSVGVHLGVWSARRISMLGEACCGDLEALGTLLSELPSSIRLSIPLAQLRISPENISEPATALCKLARSRRIPMTTNDIIQLSSIIQEAFLKDSLSAAISSATEIATPVTIPLGFDHASIPSGHSHAGSSNDMSLSLSTSTTTHGEDLSRVLTAQIAPTDEGTLLAGRSTMPSPSPDLAADTYAMPPNDLLSEEDGTVLLTIDVHSPVDFNVDLANYDAHDFAANADDASSDDEGFENEQTDDTVREVQSRTSKESSSAHTNLDVLVPEVSNPTSSHPSLVFAARSMVSCSEEAVNARPSSPVLTNCADEVLLSRPAASSLLAREELLGDSRCTNCQSSAISKCLYERGRRTRSCLDCRQRKLKCTLPGQSPKPKRRRQNAKAVSEEGQHIQDMVSSDHDNDHEYYGTLANNAHEERRDLDHTGNQGGEVSSGL